MSASEVAPVDTAPPSKGFLVTDGGTGFDVALRVLYDSDKVVLDDLLASITAVMSKSFAEADKRLGPRE